MSFYHISHSSRWAVATVTLFLLCSVSAAVAQVRIEKPLDPPGAEVPAPSKDLPRLRVGESDRVARAFAGQVDPTFAPQFDQAYGFAQTAELQADGKLVIAGGFKSIDGHATDGIARFNVDGTIDTDFRATIRGSVFKLAIQTDGKIVIGGGFYAFNSMTSRYGVARLNSDGSLDARVTAIDDSD